MNCNHVQGRLSEYIDRELDAQEAYAIRAHLTDCEQCHSEEKQLRALKSLLGNLYTTEPSADFEERLVRNVRSQAKPSTSPTLWRVPVWIATGFAALLMVSVLNQSEPTAPSLVKKSTPVHHDLAFQVQRDQVFAFGNDPTAGSSFFAQP